MSQNGNGNGTNGTTAEVLPAVQEERQDLTRPEWGSREDVSALARRLRQLLPGGEKLKPDEALTLAQYAMATDSNPYRGEVYAYSDSHGFHLVDGYKLLVRWAKREEDYSEIYRQIAADDPELPEGAIGFRCYVLRASARPFMQDLMRGGMSADDALELAATSAVGVVTKADRTTRQGGEVPPPTGWNWQQKARTRALKAALRLAYGAPSPREIARMAREDGLEASDWHDVTDEMSADEARALAEMTARERERRANAPQLSREQHQERLAQYREVLHGDDADQDLTSRPRSPVAVHATQVDDWDPAEYGFADPPSEDAPENTQPEASAPPPEDPPAEGESGNPDRQPPAEPAPAQTSANGHARLERPLAPEAVRDAIARKIGRARPAHRETQSTTAQRGLAAAKLEECFAGQDDADQKRHSVTTYVLGKASLSEVTMAEASALIDWLLDPHADPGTYDLHPAAAAEAQAVLKAALVDAGQIELELPDA